MCIRDLLYDRVNIEIAIQNGSIDVLNWMLIDPFFRSIIEDDDEQILMDVINSDNVDSYQWLRRISKSMPHISILIERMLRLKKVNLLKYMELTEPSSFGHIFDRLQNIGIHLRGDITDPEFFRYILYK